MVFLRWQYIIINSLFVVKNGDGRRHFVFVFQLTFGGGGGYH